MPYNILLAWLTKTLTYDYDDQLTSTDGASFAYDAADRQTQQTAGNSSVTSFGYDSADRKTDVWHRASGGAALGRYGYAYDGAGNVSTRTDSDGSVTTFGYDGADQLTSEARTGTGAYTVGYTYDRNGNRMGKTQGGATDTYSYDAHDKLLSTSTKNYAYDNAGSPIRITSGGVVTTLAYDAEHRLTSLSGPASDTFTYNGLGLRVGKTDSGGTRSYVCDGTDAASAVLSDGAATYTPGLSERRGGASHFTHADALGTTRGLTDSTQGATDSLLFDGFGLPVSRSGSTPTPFGFVGAGQYQTDGDTGLLLLGHRYYDASVGRFLTADPAKAGGNWYAYCGNNPLRGTDPEGLWTVGINIGFGGDLLVGGGFDVGIAIDGTGTVAITGDGYELGGLGAGIGPSGTISVSNGNLPAPDDNGTVSGSSQFGGGNLSVAGIGGSLTSDGTGDYTVSVGVSRGPGGYIGGIAGKSGAVGVNIPTALVGPNGLFASPWDTADPHDYYPPDPF